jgi:hypothetical protein
VATFDGVRGYFCEECGRQVRPASDPGVVCADKLQSGGGFGGGQRDVIGRTVYLHRDCYPSGSGEYRLKDMPPNIIDDDD